MTFDHYVMDHCDAGVRVRVRVFTKYLSFYVKDGEIFVMIDEI